MTLLLIALLAVATIYNLVVIWAAWSFSSTPAPVTNNFPPISILKPLCGTSDWLYDCLATYCTLDYPEYELLCCTARADDPAVAVVKRLQRDYPQVNLRIFVADQIHGTNGKIDNLDKMYREMRYDTLVIADDDIIAPRDYLRRLAAELDAPDGQPSGIGVVSCPYRGRPGATSASKFEALGVAGEFFGNVFVARMKEGVQFALGSTMALRKARLAEIGGFPALADFLADDYELGARIAARGHRNVLSRMVVDTQLPPDGWRTMLAHQFRWMRTQAISRPGGHLGLGVTYGSLWSFALLVWIALAAPQAWLIALAAILLWIASRCAAAYCVGVRTLDDPIVRRWWILAPLRELFTASLWLLSLFRRTVIWRGETYRTVGGKMVPIRNPRDADHN